MRISLGRLALTLGGLTLAAVIAAAYTTASSRAQPAGAPDPQMAGQIGAVVAAMNTIDSAGLHAIDESLAGSDLKPGFLGAVRKTRLVIAATPWPAELAASAKELTGHLTDLQAAIEVEDVKAAAAAASDAHEHSHDFTDEIYAWLARIGGTTPSLRGSGQGEGGERHGHGD